ncbi:MAG: hypothetical protein IAF08_01360 [Rhizobacter sp.]|nr:hypothetical protein [Chlorobiales bacterium]
MATAILFCLCVLSAASAQGLIDDKKFTSVGNIRLGVTNYGVVGNGQAIAGASTTQPSCEYPRDSRIEHLFNGGLWIGTKQGSVTKVTTANLVQSGNSNGNPTNTGYEFNATSAIGVQQRSSLLESAVYNINAVSHQDYLADFADTAVRRPVTNALINDHTPIGVIVHSESYAWNFSFTDFFVLVNYTITNRGSAAMENTYLGIFTDAVVRNTNSITSRGSEYYNKAAGGFIDSLGTMYKFDKAGEPDATRSYVGIKFLGTLFGGKLYSPATDTAYKVNYQSWQFSGTALPAPVNDFDRYGKMSTTIPPTDPLRNTLKTNDNRVELISAGPIPRIEVGESVTVVFAVVCAKAVGSTANYTADSISSKKTFFENIGWAQRTFNGEDRNGNGVLDTGEDRNLNGKLDRYVLPAPPRTPKVKVLVQDRKATLYWDKATAEESIDPISNLKDFEGYRIYRTNAGDDLAAGITSSLNPIAQYDRAGDRSGYDNGFAAIALPAPITFTGDTTQYAYKYQLSNLLNGWKYGVAVTAFDSGDAATGLISLESSSLSTLNTIVPGSAAASDDEKSKKVGVYPNPYYVRAAWDITKPATGGQAPTPLRDGRKVYFSNLPEESDITIYTVSGDVIDRFTHSISSGGTEAPWDIISKADQQLATGLYIVSVRNTRTGDVRTARFVIIK